MMSDAKKGHKLTKEHRDKVIKTLWSSKSNVKHPNKGRVWVNNGVTNKLLKPSDLQDALKAGYVYGQLRKLR